MKCAHTTTTSLDDIRCFCGSVAMAPYTDENPCAHGGICNSEKCCQCGATRSVNSNGSHVELGPWGPSEAEQRHQTAIVADAKRRASVQIEDAAVAAQKVNVIEVRDGAALLDIGQRRMWVSTLDISSAARQEDNGDGLVPFYRGLSRLVGRA